MVKKNKLEDIIGVVKRLRNPKNGCPWDIEQTSKSLSKYTLEEAYEVVEAIEKGNFNELEDEFDSIVIAVGASIKRSLPILIFIVFIYLFNNNNNVSINCV